VLDEREAREAIDTWNELFAAELPEELHPCDDNPPLYSGSIE